MDFFFWGLLSLFSQATLSAYWNIANTLTEIDKNNELCRLKKTVNQEN